MSGRWQARTVVALSCVVLLTHCASGEPRSTTPQITSDATFAAVLEPALLTSADLTGVAGFDGAQVHDIGDASAYENPDPRGPCGAIIDGLPVDDAAGRVVEGETTLLFQLATTDPDGSVYFDALAADLRPHCGPFESITNLGDRQETKDVRPLTLDDVDVEALAWTAQITVGDLSVFGGLVALRTDEVFVYLQMQADRPIPESTVRAIARAAAAKLA